MSQQIPCAKLGVLSTAQPCKGGISIFGKIWARLTCLYSNKTAAWGLGKLSILQCILTACTSKQCRMRCKSKAATGQNHRKTGRHHTKFHRCIASNSEPPLQNRPVLCGERRYQQLWSELVLHRHFADRPFTVWEGIASADAYNSRNIAIMQAKTPNRSPQTKATFTCSR